ncbi:class I SAM-dependent DNA methyltransferase [Clostridium sp. LBM24168]
MNCYRNFAYIYDYLINTDVNYSIWCNKILKICKKYNINSGKYLDIGCGTGNLTEKIAPFFDSIWCVDFSNDMLAEAESKFRNKNLKITLICQNMIELNLNMKFDLITCCLDSTNYILNEQNLIKYFTAVFNHLKSNGIFVFDINSYYKLTKILGNNVYDYDDDKLTYIWDNNLENEIIDMYLIFFIKEGKLYRRFDEHHRERAYQCDYIENLLSKCGFIILEKLNNYTDKPLKKDSERIVYVVSKGDSNDGR